MNDFVKNQIPKNFQDDIQRAIQLLKKHGCKEIYLFGSLASGNFGVGSDIDLAIRGCNPENYFQIYGELLMELEHPVDLINLDREDDFTKFIEDNGGMVSVH
mgnify:CR=1 FL=1